MYNVTTSSSGSKLTKTYIKMFFRYVHRHLTRNFSHNISRTNLYVVKLNFENLDFTNSNVIFHKHQLIKIYSNDGFP